MRHVLWIVALSMMGWGCAQPVSVYHENLDKQRYTRVNLRSNDNAVYSANYLAYPNSLQAGSPAVVTMYSDLEVRLNVHGAAYVMRPVNVPKFNTDATSIETFLDRYFVDDKAEIGLDAMAPEMRSQVLNGNYAIGMTKEEIYTCLGPPVAIDGDLPAANLPRSQIMASNRWKYIESVIVFVPKTIEIIFHENKAQDVLR